MKKNPKKVNWLIVMFIVFVFGVGIICGIGLGIRAGQMILFEGMGVALADSNINITINLNETKLIEGFREVAEEVIVPAFNQSIKNDS